MMKGLDLLHEQLEHHKKSLQTVDESIKKLDSPKEKDESVDSRVKINNINQKTIQNVEKSASQITTTTTTTTTTSTSNRIVKLNSSLSDKPLETRERVSTNTSNSKSNDRESERYDRNGTVKRKITDRNDYRESSKKSSRSNHNNGYDSGDDAKKPTIKSSVVSSNMPIKSKEDLIKIQNKYNGSEQRNKRILGVIVGTLKQFKSDDKERSSTAQAINRKELEKKIEIKKVEEKKRIIEEKKKLEEEKYKQLRNIEIIEQKIRLTEEYELWKKHQLELKKFIRSKVKPYIFYMPKIMNETSEKLLGETCTILEADIAKKLQETEKEIESLNKESESLSKINDNHHLDDKENKQENEAKMQVDSSSDSELDEDKNNINVRIGEEIEEQEDDQLNLNSTNKDASINDTSSVSIDKNDKTENEMTT